MSRTEIRHEKSDVNIAYILATAGVLTMTCVMVALGLWGMIRVFSIMQPKIAPNPMAEQRRTFPGPGLEATVSRELQEIRESEDQHLHKYVWVNEAQKTARIPIEEAMSQIARNGLPQWQPPKNDSAGPQRPTPSPNEVQRPFAPSGAPRESEGGPRG